MGPGLQAAIVSSRAVAARGWEVVLALAVAVGGRWLVLGCACAGVVLAGGAWALLARSAPGPSDSAATNSQPPAYVIVCAHCGHRAPATPAARPRERQGVLRCPVCDRATAALYRHGSQSVPPGGWSSGSPGKSRAGDAAGNPDAAGGSP